MCLRKLTWLAIVFCSLTIVALADCTWKCNNLGSNEQWHYSTLNGDPQWCYDYNFQYGDYMWAPLPTGGNLVSPISPEGGPIYILKNKYTDCAEICTGKIASRVQAKGTYDSFVNWIQQYCLPSTGTGGPGGPGGG
jgi:hypothetical protein